MKRIYSHDNRLIVYNLMNLLQSEGIDCEIRNEFSGGAVGDLATIDTWPELWVEHERDADPAKQLIDKVMKNTVDSSWFCQQCHEVNGAAFKICWNCNHSFE